MLSIRQLLLAFSSIYIILLMVSLIAVRLIWLYPAEVSTQLEQQQQEFRNLDSVLTIVADQLADQAKNHARWVDTLYQHQEDEHYHRPTTYDLDNVLPESIDIAFALSQDKSAIYAVERSGQSFINIAHTDIFNAFDLNNLEPFLNNKAHKDIIKLNESYYLIASNSIPAIMSYETVAWVFLLQKLDDVLWQKLGNISELTINHANPKSANLVEALPLSAPISKVAQTHQRCLFNSFGENILCLELTHNSWKKFDKLDFDTNLIIGFIVFFPLAVFFIFVSQILKLLHKTMTLFKEADEKSSLKPITFEYWIPIKELKEFKGTYNNLVSTISRQRQELETLSNTDKLTGIYNRRYFDTHFQNTWNRLKRHSMSAALVLVDIDLFKKYNDLYGHQQGDKALNQVAQAIAGCARRVDEFTARYGGEEFASIVFLENEYELELFYKRFNNAITQLNIIHEDSTVSEHLTVSAGAAWLQKSGKWVENYLPEDWLKAADEALYRAKNSGRNRIETIVINEQEPFS